MALAVWALTSWLPSPAGIDTMPDRIAYALRVNLVALIPYFVMLIAIGNSRFLSDAIDPTRRAETPTQQVDGRVADNTLQQNFVFVVASLALATRHVGHRVPEPRHDSLRAVFAGERSVTTR